MRTIIKSTLLLLFMMPMSFFAQSTLSGTVTEDETGMPIPGVNVLIKGTTTGTTTDFDGQYTLTNLAENDVVVFSYVGFAPQEIVYAGQQQLDLLMAPDQWLWVY